MISLHEALPRDLGGEVITPRALATRLTNDALLSERPGTSLVGADPTGGMHIALDDELSGGGDDRVDVRVVHDQIVP